MRERGRKNRTSATMLAGWKKAVVLMLALIVCISSIVVPQPEEESAKISPKIKSCLQHRMMPNGIKQMKAAVMFPKTMEHTIIITA
mgnify:CR=1 FL=1